MSTLFALLFLAALVCLLAGLIRPSPLSHLFKGIDPSQKKVCSIFGGIAVLFLFLANITGGSTNLNPETVTPSPTTEILALSSKATPATLYSVISVVDGDTIKVDIAGKTETIRLIGIDTPETVDPRKEVQCFGQEASDHAKQLLIDKNVQLVTDPSQGDLDKYNRLLRYILLEDGTDFNKLMIADGFAHEYTYNSPYARQNDYKQAQKDAESGEKGLWSPATCGGNTNQDAATPAPSATPDPTPTPAQSSNEPNVKMSTSKICHAKDTQYYAQTKNYTAYDSIDACLAAGGRLPK